MVAANFDFHWITQRGEADKLDGSSDKQTHFEEPTSLAWIKFDFGDRGRSADFERSQRLTFRRHIRPLSGA